MRVSNQKLFRTLPGLVFAGSLLVSGTASAGGGGDMVPSAVLTINDEENGLVTVDASGNEYDATVRKDCLNGSFISVFSQHPDSITGRKWVFDVEQAQARNNAQVTVKARTTAAANISCGKARVQGSYKNKNFPETGKGSFWMKDCDLNQTQFDNLSEDCADIPGLKIEFLDLQIKRAIAKVKGSL